MRNILMVSILLILMKANSFAQNNIGIGTTTPHASAVLDVSSTNRGLLLPRMSAVQRNAISSPSNGLIVFDTDSAALMLRSAGGWRRLTTTATPGGFWQVNGTNIYNLNTGNVGIGTNNPQARLHVADSSVVFTAPSVLPDNAGNTPVVGPGYRMMWFANKAALRLGRTTGNQSDAAQIGQLSFAAGQDNVVSGFASGAFGTENIVRSGYNFAAGYGNESRSVAAAAFGFNNIVKAQHGFVIGLNNDTTDIAVGDIAAVTDRLFQIGNGSSFNNRGNALTVLRSGHTGIGKVNPLALLHISGSTATNARPDLWLNSAGPVGGNTIRFSTPAALGVGWGMTAYTNADFNSAANSFWLYRTVDSTGGLISPMLTIRNNGNIALGNVFASSPLTFTASLGKKIALYPGTTGDVGFGVYGNELRQYIDGQNGSITFGYDDFANGFTERLRMSAKGDLRIATDQQSIQFVSNGNAANEPMIKMFESGLQNPNRMVIGHSTAYKSWGLGYNDLIDQFDFKGNNEARVSINLSSGFVGLADSVPQYRLDVRGRIRLQSAGSENSSAGIWLSKIADRQEQAFIGMRSDTSVGIYTNAASPSSPDWRMLLNTNTGYISLGNFSANAPLHFNNNLQNRKIILYENANNDHQYYGFGINGSTLRYQTDASNADHVFYSAASASSSTELFRIKGNGAIGINQANPGVYGHGGTSRVLEIWNNSGVDNDVQSHLVLSTSGGGGSMGGVTWATTALGGEQKAAFVGAAYESGSNNALFQVMLRRNGSLAQRFRVNSDGSAFLQGSLTQNSDATLKKNIEPISDAGALLSQLHGYRYQWKDENADAERQLGLLAQEVQKVLPELVKEGENGKLGVNYSGLIPVLLEALKEQQNELKRQRILNAKQDKLIEELTELVKKGNK